MHKFCNEPFSSIRLTNTGYNVCCWHATFDYGKDFTIDQKNLEKVRNTIIDGSYSMCSKHCPKLNEFDKKPMLEVPDVSFKSASIAFDDSCNLYCPSCRNSIRRGLVSSHDFENAVKLVMDNSSSIEVLDLSGSGESLVSKNMIKFISGIRGNFPNLKHVVLHTNGTLMTEGKLDWFINSINGAGLTVMLSIDAFTEDVYKMVRRGGNFSNVEKCVELLLCKRGNGVSSICVNFIVQDDNISELPDFLGKYIDNGIDIVNISDMMDWGHLGKDNYMQRTKSHRDGRLQRLVSLLPKKVENTSIKYEGNLIDIRGSNLSKLDIFDSRAMGWLCGISGEDFDLVGSVSIRDSVYSVIGFDGIVDDRLTSLLNRYLITIS